VLGELGREKGQYQEGLAIYEKAEALGFVQGKERLQALLNSMAICHQQLHQWIEAVACCKEAVEHHRNVFGTNHPAYAAVLSNLALLFDDLKQYEEAIPRYEEALIICKRVFGDQDERTVILAQRLAA
jgi:tetratricopeptide (TPR) repeat protein